MIHLLEFEDKRLCYLPKTEKRQMGRFVIYRLRHDEFGSPYWVKLEGHDDKFGLERAMVELVNRSMMLERAQETLEEVFNMEEGTLFDTQEAMGDLEAKDVEELRTALITSPEGNWMNDESPT